MTAILAFDTATERMLVAVANGLQKTWSREEAGGAKASARLLPCIFDLLREAGLALHDLDAIAFGRGPGAFTGLRTACSVAQGLAFGAAKPVLPVDSLLAVAEDARAGAEAFEVWVVVDARMNQIYAAEYAFQADAWVVRQAPQLSDAAALSERWRRSPAQQVAGSALDVFGAGLETGAARRLPGARATGAALVAVAQRTWRDGGSVDPAEALPLYVRDKVAETTREREAKR